MDSMPSPEKVGPWPRFGARFVDGLLLFIPVMIVTVPFAGGFAIGTDNAGGKQFVGTTLGVLLSYAYFVFMESSRGSTVGKRMFSIEVEADAGKPTVAQSAQRNAWMLLSIIPGGLGGLISFGIAIAIAISIHQDPEGRGFHDRFGQAHLTRRR